MRQSINWYDENVKNSEQLRESNVLVVSKIQKALSDLSLENMDIINNFQVFLTNDGLCNKLFGGSLNFKIIDPNNIEKGSILSNNKVRAIIKKYKIKVSQYLSVRVLNYLFDERKKFSDYWSILDSNGDRKLITVGGDDFTNHTCISHILNSLFKDIHFYVRQYDSFYCEGNGYSVYEDCNMGTLRDFLISQEINDKLIQLVLQSILIPFEILKRPKYKFNHSDLKVDNIYVNVTNNKAELKIGNFEKSSITYNGFRFYNKTGDYNINDVIKTKIREDGIETYSINSILLPVHYFTMHNPYGVPASYDIYTFILSLFSIDKIWVAYTKEQLPIFKKLLHRLFLEENYYKVLGAISTNNKSMSDIKNINNLLNNLPLLYDISFLYTDLGCQPPPLTSDNVKVINIKVSKDSHICSDDCKINASHSSSDKTCNTNKYSKKSLTGVSIYDWDYC